MNLSKDAEISTNDMQSNKNLFKKSCQLASFGLFEATKTIDEAETGQIYSEDELNEISSQVDKFYDQFISDIFKEKRALS